MTQCIVSGRGCGEMCIRQGGEREREGERRRREREREREREKKKGEREREREGRERERERERDPPQNPPKCLRFKTCFLIRKLCRSISSRSHHSPSDKVPK